jgi:hypothetical protein
MDILSDNRGLTNNLIIFIASLLFAAVLYIGLQPIGMGLVDAQSSVTTSQAAAAGQDYQRWLWQGLPWIVVLIGGIQLLVRASIEGRIGT